MRELSLFSGGGGGLLAGILLDWTPIGYVEINDYCQRIIRQRIEDGHLPDAPIFGNIQAFLSEGYAAAYKDMVNVLSAGFPCQPFSVAGKRAGADDQRNMWPATLECIRQVRPQFAFLENVPGLLTSGYFGTILGDLAESGYDCRWRILSTAELGAPHLRKRLWIVAHARRQRMGRIQQESQSRRNNATNISQGGEVMADANGERQPQSQGAITHQRRRTGNCNWWTTEPNVGRVVNELAHRVDRLKALGNGQVPTVAATAWNLLTDA